MPSSPDDRCPGQAGIPTPGEAAPWRWWDGAQWTGYSSAGGGPAWPAMSAVELRRAHDKEERLWRWARLALVAVLIIVVGQGLAAIWMGHTFHHFWRVAQVNNGNQQVTEISGFSFRTGLLFDVFYLVAAAVSIVFLVWQHTAATVARALGYPARTSPRVRGGFVVYPGGQPVVPILGPVRHAATEPSLTRPVPEGMGGLHRIRFRRRHHVPRGAGIVVGRHCAHGHLGPPGGHRRRAGSPTGISRR